MLNCYKLSFEEKCSGSNLVEESNRMLDPENED